MELLQNGVDRAVIAFWLGREWVETTNVYLPADLNLKEAALAKTAPMHGTPARCLLDGEVLAFLSSL